MKFLLLLVVILAVIWVARGGRRRAVKRDPPPPPIQEEMIACRQCGLHLPRSDALPGRGGLFCSEAHRRAFEQAASSDPQ